MIIRITRRKPGYYEVIEEKPSNMGQDVLVYTAPVFPEALKEVLNRYNVMPRMIRMIGYSSEMMRLEFY